MLFKKKAYKDVTATEVKEMVGGKNVQIIDVREPYEFTSGHINSALNIPLKTVSSQLSRIKKDKSIVVVCASGARSKSASKYLADEGYDVYNMKGGMMMWR